MRKPSCFLLRSIRQGLATSKWKHISSRPGQSPFQMPKFLSLFGTTNKDLRIFCFEGNAFLSSNTQQYSHFSSLENSVPTFTLRTTGVENGKINRPGVEILSVENIRPAVPTPRHLRTYEVSILDQLNPNIYMSFVYFYLNNDQNGSQLINHDLILTRRQLLKQSLSETLTRFYPLAGKVQDDRFIDCNDDGVYYVEAKVSEGLSDFLNQPENKSIHELLPFDPSSMELPSKTYVIMIQATVFKCGGIAIGLYTSHKIIDGYSHAAFLKAWAAMARGALEDAIPNFISPSIFLPSPAQPANGMVEMFGLYSKQGKSVTRRFVFLASSLSDLKKKAEASSRVMAVTGLIWKCAMDASRMKSSSDGHDSKSSVLILTVNLRARSSPPFPPCSIGNIVWPACAPHEADDDVGGVSSIVGLMENAADKINIDFIEKMKGEEGSSKVKEYLNEMRTLFSDKNAELMAVTSLCNSGIYEADFGWGKPVWASVGDADADIPLFGNIVYLLDTSSGDGIEAWVTLGEEEMAIFQRDAEIVAYALLNPSPLQMA